MLVQINYNYIIIAITKITNRDNGNILKITNKDNGNILSLNCWNKETIAKINNIKLNEKLQGRDMQN